MKALRLPKYALEFLQSSPKKLPNGTPCAPHSFCHLIQMQSLDTSEKDHLLIIGAQRLEGFLEAIKSFFSTLCPALRQAILGDIRVYWASPAKLLTPSLLLNHVIGYARQPREERCLALPLKITDGLKCSEECLLYDVLVVVQFTRTAFLDIAT